MSFLLIAHTDSPFDMTVRDLGFRSGEQGRIGRNPTSRSNGAEVGHVLRIDIVYDRDGRGAVSEAVYSECQKSDGIPWQTS